MKKRVVTCILVSLLIANLSFAESPIPFRALTHMPVKEITVFKDGHAFLLHQGKMQTDENGNVVMDYLPTAVIGTFWPFSADRKAKLSSVTANQRKVMVERTALSLPELIEANVGAQVIVTEVPSATNQVSYAATILEIPTLGSDEQETVVSLSSDEKKQRRSDVVLLKTELGIKVVSLNRIQDIRFTKDYRKTIAEEKLRNLLTLNMEWDGDKPQKNVDAGLLYLQRGIRWIPNYKVTIDGNGQAIVQLQATLINELLDIKDVTAHLVIGVPTFEFKDIPDPISLQNTVARLSQYFPNNAQTAYGFAKAKAITSQAGMGYEVREEAARRTLDLGPEVAESGKSEDLFIFTVKHVSMKKGQRMTLKIGEFRMKYKDVFSLDIPMAPPIEMWHDLNNNQLAELTQEEMFNTPKVMHKIRLFNSSEYPLTTAPALILKDDRLLAQGLMTYASPGADSDLNITSAMDIRVKKIDNELKRTLNAANWEDYHYSKIELSGKITLTNFREDVVEVEVNRNVFGNVDSSDNGGKIERINFLESLTSSATRTGTQYPSWWKGISLPWWWGHFNGAGRIAWTVKLEPRKPFEVGYTWNYYWGR